MNCSPGMCNRSPDCQDLNCPGRDAEHDLYDPGAGYVWMAIFAGIAIGFGCLAFIDLMRDCPYLLPFVCN